LLHNSIISKKLKTYSKLVPKDWRLTDSYKALHMTSFTINCHSPFNDIIHE